MKEALRKLWVALGFKAAKKADGLLSESDKIEAVVAARERAHVDLQKAASKVIGAEYAARMTLRRAEEELQFAREMLRDFLGMEPEPNESNERTKEVLMGEVIQLERSVEELSESLRRHSEASFQAKERVRENADELQAIVTEKAHLLSKARQADMEEIHAQVLDVFQEQPSLETVAQSINERYAQALGVQELGADSRHGRKREVQRAIAKKEIERRLQAEIEALGLPSKTTEGNN